MGCLGEGQDGLSLVKVNGLSFGGGSVGLMAIFRVVGIGIELRLNFINLVVYPGFFSLIIH